MVFKYPKSYYKAAKLDRENPIIGKPYKKPDEEMGLIEGRTPRSREEWRVAVALWRYKVEFRYQVPIMGGSMVRGGQLLDFLLLVDPSPIPLQIFGNYWHRAQIKNEDRFKISMLRQQFGIDPVVIWGSELQTQDEANTKIREVLSI